MKNVFVLYILLALNICEAYSQTLNPEYDAALAEKLGSDENGMKSYIFVILKTGTVQIDDKQQRALLFKGHIENINRLADEGKLFVAGPFGKNDLSYRGLFILNVKTEEEAKLLCESDPAVKAGLFEVVLLPWYGSAALGEYLDASKKIAKYKM